MASAAVFCILPNYIFDIIYQKERRLSMDIFSNLQSNGATQFLITCIIVGVLLSFVIYFARYIFESLIKFILSFSVIRYGLLACLVLFTVKEIVAI